MTPGQLRAATTDLPSQSTRSGTDASLDANPKVNAAPLCETPFAANPFWRNQTAQPLPADSGLRTSPNVGDVLADPNSTNTWEGLDGGFAG